MGRQIGQRGTQSTLRLTLRLLPLVLLLGLLLHQLGLAATHDRAHAANGDTHATGMMTEGPHGSCPGHLPHPRICPSIRAFVQRLPLTLPLFALIAAPATLSLRRGTAWCLADWMWPPDKRRALLQVFLC